MSSCGSGGVSAPLRPRLLGDRTDRLAGPFELVARETSPMKHTKYSPEQLRKALREFEDVVGRDWLFTGADDLALYRDAYSPFFGEPSLEYQAGGAVAPASVEEVQAIVRIANHYGIPLHP